MSELLLIRAEYLTTAKTMNKSSYPDQRCTKNLVYILIATVISANEESMTMMTAADDPLVTGLM